MITNSSLTVYHKYLDKETRLEKWERLNFDKVWFFGGKGASTNKGYENANDVEIRIPYSFNNIIISKFTIGDILVKGTLKTEIKTQKDLIGHEVYNITSITDNKFGNTPHLHLGGK